MKGKLFEELRKAIINYDVNLAEELAKNTIDNGIDPIETIEILTKSIAEIGEKFEKNELFLPELMMGAKMLQLAMGPLDEEMKKRGLKVKSAGKVVIGTVYGDIHDIGKNIVATLLKANGFDVMDLGINVKSKNFIESVKNFKPEILAIILGQ